jgi:hypothetical protein
MIAVHAEDGEDEGGGGGLVGHDDINTKIVIRVLSYLN